MDKQMLAAFTTFAVNYLDVQTGSIFVIEIGKN